MSKVTPLKKLRKSKGVSLKSIAEVVNSDTGNLSRIERAAQTPGLSLATAIAEFFDYEITEMEILYPFKSRQSSDS